MALGKLGTTLCVAVVLYAVAGADPTRGSAGVAAAAVPARARPVVEASGPRPAWVSQGDTYAAGGKQFAKAYLDDQVDLRVALERAKYAAVRNLTESIVSTVQSEYKHSRTSGSNRIGDRGEWSELTTSQMSAVTGAIHLVGVQKEDSYWEKRLVRVEGQEVPAYRVYVLVSLPSEFLRQAREEVMDAVHDIRGEQPRRDGGDQLKDGN